MQWSRFVARTAGQNGRLKTLIGLGLNKLGRRVTLEDTPAVRGMLKKVQHLVQVVDGK